MKDIKQLELSTLFDSANEFSFFQLIRFYKKAYSSPNSSSKPLRLLTNKSLAFPASDTVSGCATLSRDEGFYLLINFLGLYGVDSPLSQDFNRAILQDTEAAQTLKAILDILNQEFYGLLYLAWMKFRVEIQLEAGQLDFLYYLTAITGNKLKISDRQLLKYVNVFGQQETNPVALGYLIKDLFALNVTIDDLSCHWVKLDNYSLIGKDNDKLCLGDNSILGTKILTMNNVLIINVEPVSIKYYIAEFINGVMLDEIKHVLQLYLPWHISYKLKINVLFSETHITMLAKVNTMLGVDCCLGNTDSLQNVFSFV